MSSTYTLYIFAEQHQLNVSSQVNSNMTMYDKNILLYHGLDNKLNFAFLDQDRNKYDLTGDTVYFRVQDIESKETIFAKTMTVDSAINGTASVSFTATELYEVADGFYNFTAYVEDATKTQSVVYTDRAGQITGTLEIIDGAIPKARPTQTTTAFTLRNTYNYSDNLSGASERNLTARNHTISLYSTNFTGNVRIEGNLDDTPSTSDSDWFPIDVVGMGINDITMTAHTGPTPFFFQSSSRHIRVRYKAGSGNSGTFDKMLLRN